MSDTAHTAPQQKVTSLYVFFLTIEGEEHCGMPAGRILAVATEDEVRLYESYAQKLADQYRVPVRAVRFDRTQEEIASVEPTPLIQRVQ